jgi:uncharacterized repeat protein (TIGR04052 family)
MRAKLWLGLLGACVVGGGCGDDASSSSDAGQESSDGGSSSTAADAGQSPVVEVEEDAGSGAGDAEEDAAAASDDLDGGDPLDAGAADAGAEADAGPHMMDVAIAFEAKVGQAAFSCEASYESLGTALGLTTRVNDFRFYVSDVKLINADGDATALELTQGGAWQYGDVALLDFENRKGTCSGTGTSEVNTTLHGKVPHGTYSGLAFTVGVPELYNHLDTAGRDTPSPLNIQAMAWNWASGRKFFRLDLSSTSTSSDGGAPVDAGKFVIHLGSTYCPKMGEPDAAVPGSCKNSNRPEIVLAGFDLEDQKVVVDVAAAVSGSALNFNTPSTASGCMSDDKDPECPAVFDRFGLSLDGGMPDGDHPQTVFSVAAK